MSQKSTMLIALSFAAILCGCSATHPTVPHGVLSTIHQKTLELSALRAMEQAEVNKERFGTKTITLEFSDLHESDLGKQHVARVITDQFDKVSAGVVNTEPTDTQDVKCQLLLAGVDVSQGEAFGFRWIDTKAEVSIRVKYKNDGQSIEKNGTGNAVYQQSWWLGIGPSEKLK